MQLLNCQPFIACSIHFWQALTKKKEKIVLAEIFIFLMREYGPGNGTKDHYVVIIVLRFNCSV